MGNVTLVDDNKALVASGRERDAIIHRRCHLIECLGCRIVKMISVDNEMAVAAHAGASTSNLRSDISSLEAQERSKHHLHRQIQASTPKTLHMLFHPQSPRPHCLKASFQSHLFTAHSPSARPRIWRTPRRMLAAATHKPGLPDAEQSPGDCDSRL